MEKQLKKLQKKQKRLELKEERRSKRLELKRQRKRLESELQDVRQNVQLTSQIHFQPSMVDSSISEERQAINDKSDALMEVEKAGTSAWCRTPLQDLKQILPTEWALPTSENQMIAKGCKPQGSMPDCPQNQELENQMMAGIPNQEIMTEIPVKGQVMEIVSSQHLPLAKQVTLEGTNSQDTMPEDQVMSGPKLEDSDTDPMLSIVPSQQLPVTEEVILEDPKHQDMDIENTLQLMGKGDKKRNENDSDYDSDNTVCYSMDDLPSLPGWNSSLHTDTTRSDDGSGTEIYESYDSNSSDNWLRKMNRNKYIISEESNEGTHDYDMNKDMHDENKDASLNRNSARWLDSDSSDLDSKYPPVFRGILESYDWNKDTDEDSSDEDDCGNSDLDNALKSLLGGPSKPQASNNGGSKSGTKRKAPSRPPKPAKRARRRYDSDGDRFNEDSDSYESGLLNGVSKVLSGAPTSNDNKNSNKVKIPNALEEDEEEYGVAELYDDYMPLKLKIGRQHPDPVVETASLASVEPTDVSYQLLLPEQTISEGKLSALQLEAVVYSSQAHEHTLPDGSRAGFLIGDGAGVGKGRTVAGVIFENWLRGRKKAIWVSISNDLKLDAERDLSDIGASEIQVHLLKDYKYVKLSDIEELSEGVMFMTYSALSSKGRAPKDTTLRLRLDQLLEWCGDDFDGVIVFDECHRAKNLCPAGGKGKPTKAGLSVLTLQQRLPRARLVYASATGASEPKNMAYMVRLGLWGQGTAFANSADFIKVVEKGGVGAMEIVAMDMKLRGMYIARQLSFRGVSFNIEEVPLSGNKMKAYDSSVALWVKAKSLFTRALDLYFSVEAEDPRMRMAVWAQFWGAHQRFFKYLCIAVKVDRAAEIARQAVADGKCAVIGLQSTGEARTLVQLEQQTEELNEFLSTAEGVFKNLVETQMPGTKKKISNKSVASQLRTIQSSLLADIDKLSKILPRNMLDELVDKLGGPEQVAEMTGRKGRLVKTTENGRQVVQYESRCDGECTLDTLNIREKQRFMDGDKLVAIISEAASSGISLQSDRRVANTRRRVHITIELPWSADRAIQQFGRTHRSNQTNAPQYVFLISELAGERRFASIVAKRLESLGALTHGDRRATETRDLSQFNVDNKYGKNALAAVLHTVRGGYQKVDPPADFPDFVRHARVALENVGLIEPEEGGYALTRVLATSESWNMTKFLNRLLGVPVKLQNCLFKYFVDNLAKVTDEARRSGTFDQGIVDVRGACCVRTLRVLRAHATGHAAVTLHTLQLDRGMDWDSAYRKYTSCDGAFYLAKVGPGSRRNILLYIGDVAKPQIYRPGTGLQRAEPLSELQRKYDKLQGFNWKSRARDIWSRNHEDSKTVCSHAFFRTCQPDCKWGLRSRTYYVLAGSVLAVWDQLEFQRMQVVRVRLQDGSRIVGTMIPASCVDAIENSLKIGAVSVETKSH